MTDSAPRLHAVEDGPPHADAVLVLHGFTGSAAAMAPLRERLSPHHRVIAADLPGHGQSATPDDVAAYSFDATVDALIRLLDDLDVEIAHLAGYSMGGRMALALACGHPERVRSAVLIGASAGIEDDPARAARRDQDDALADRIEGDGLDWFVDHWAALPLFETQNRLGPEHGERMRQQRLANDPAGLAGSLRGAGSGAQPLLHAALGRSAVPLLFVTGAEDTKFTAIAHDLADRAPDATTSTIGGAGHATHLEAPDAVADAALEFYARHPVRPS